MHNLLFIVLCLVVTACNHDGSSSHHRSYVISKSTETVEDSETVVEPLGE